VVASWWGGLVSDAMVALFFKVRSESAPFF
jgi:hypothetical protein